MAVKVVQESGFSFLHLLSFSSEQINGDVAKTVDVDGSSDVLLENEGESFYEKTSNW